MTLALDSEFPGGNIVVEDIQGDHVRMRQDLRDTMGDWFYWCCRVRGAAGRTLRFTMTGSRALAGRGPAVSWDEGQTWGWLGTESVKENTFLCAFPPGTDEARLSFAMPYQESHWRRFLESLPRKTPLSRQRLALTRKGREAEYVLLGAAEPTCRVAITCRHHACEMMADYVLEGLIRRIAGADDPDARWLRENAEFLIVPFMDKDGVEDGDQGKNRQPRDHNRDYAGASVHVETAALRNLLPEWGQGRLRMALDLHDPHVSGRVNEVIFLVGSPDPVLANEQRRFSTLLENVCRGPLPFHAADFLPFGAGWNTGGNETSGKSFGRWAGGLPGIRLATGIEIPYANASGAEVNQESARRLGDDLVSALAAYLKEAC